MSSPEYYRNEHLTEWIKSVTEATNKTWINKHIEALKCATSFCQSSNLKLHFSILKDIELSARLGRWALNFWQSLRIKQSQFVRWVSALSDLMYGEHAERFKSSLEGSHFIHLEMLLWELQKVVWQNMKEEETSWWNKYPWTEPALEDHIIGVGWQWCAGGYGAVAVFDRNFCVMEQSLVVGSVEHDKAGWAIPLFASIYNDGCTKLYATVEEAVEASRSLVSFDVEDWGELKVLSSFSASDIMSQGSWNLVEDSGVHMFEYTSPHGKSWRVDVDSGAGLHVTLGETGICTLYGGSLEEWFKQILDSEHDIAIADAGKTVPRSFTFLSNVDTSDSKKEANIPYEEEVLFFAYSDSMTPQNIVDRTGTIPIGRTFYTLEDFELSASAHSPKAKACYYTISRRKGASVDGALLTLKRWQLARLRAWEEMFQYLIGTVSVTLPDGTTSDVYYSYFVGSQHKIPEQEQKNYSKEVLSRESALHTLKAAKQGEQHDKV